MPIPKDKRRTIDAGAEAAASDGRSDRRKDGVAPASSSSCDEAHHERISQGECPGPVRQREISTALTTGQVSMMDDRVCDGERSEDQGRTADYASDKGERDHLASSGARR